MSTICLLHLVHDSHHVDDRGISFSWAHVPDSEPKAAHFFIQVAVGDLPGPGSGALDHSLVLHSLGREQRQERTVLSSLVIPCQVDLGLAG